jgi:uncharacterized protein (TIRG00374 family)
MRAIGPLLLVVVIWRLEDKGALWEAVRAAHWQPLALATLLVVPNVYLKVLRWQLLLSASGHRYPLRNATLAVLSSLYLGMVTPGRVGDLLRVHYARHEAGVPYSDGLAVTVMDRICDLYVLVAFVALGIAHFTSVLRGELAYLTWGAVIVSTLAPLALLLPGLADGLMGRIYRRLPGSSAGGLERFLRSLRALVGRRLAVVIPLTIASFVLNYVQGGWIARAIGAPLGVMDIVAMLSITSLLSLTPISVSGVGVRELFLALIFPTLGLPAAQGVVFGLLFFICNYLAVVAVGFVAWQIAPPPVAAADPRDGTPGA